MVTVVLAPSSDRVTFTSSRMVKALVFITEPDRARPEEV